MGVEYEGGVPKDANGVPITADSPPGTTPVNIVWHDCSRCGTRFSVREVLDYHSRKECSG